MLPPAHHLIGITGRAHTGKDSAGAHLVRQYGFCRAAFADALKDMLEQMLAEAGEDHAWLHQPSRKNVVIPRLGVSAWQMMQTLGDWGCGLHPEWWVRLLALRVGYASAPEQAAPVHDRIVVTDVRFPNEAAWIRALGGQLIRLRRDQAPGVRHHCSEQHVDQLEVDVDLWNNGPTLVGLHGLVDGAMADFGITPRPTERYFDATFVATA